MNKVTKLHVSPSNTDSIWAGTEDALAIGFVGSNPHLRYVASWNKWYLWNGSYWQEDSTLETFDKIRKHCREYEFEDKTKRKNAAKAQSIAAVEKLAKADRKYAAIVDQWDKDIWQLNTPSGVINLKSVEFIPHDPAYYQTKITSVAPKGVPCPIWGNFLDKITDGDRELIEFLQRVCAYCLSGSTREHAFFFIYGTGANGKGTFLNTLTEILGSYASTAPMDVFTQSFGDKHPTELAMLQGSRLVVAQETEQGRRWNESRIKSITGGDPVTARFMRQDFFTFTPQFKLMIAGNHKPQLRNVDEAMRRRLYLIPFTVTIPKKDRDPELFEKLKPEWPGILQWMIDGLQEYHDRKLAPPEVISEATEDYFVSQDVFSEWVDECCVTPEPEATTEERQRFWETPTSLFNSWKRYAETANERIGTTKTFADKLESHGFVSDRTTATRQWKGLKLRVNSQEHKDNSQEYKDRRG